MSWTDVRDLFIAGVLAVGGVLLALMFVVFAVVLAVGIPVGVVAGIVWAVIIVLQHTGVI